MTIKLQPQALAISNKNLVIENLPDSLKKEINQFILRNKIEKNYYCERCLNAYLLKKASEMKLESILKGMKEKTKEEMGHAGYYLDANELVKM